MALMSDVDLPVAHVRAHVASAIDLVVHTARLRDGRRVGVPDRGRRRPRRRGRARRDRGLRSARPLAGTGPCTRTHRAGRSSAGFFPAKRPAIWSSLASPALMRRPHAHPGEDRYRHIHAISLPTVELPTTRLIETARKWTIHCDRRRLATLARRPHFYSSGSQGSPYSRGVHAVPLA